jgi:copper(I)-binding protein
MEYLFVNQNKARQGLRVGAWVLCGALALSACSKSQEGTGASKPAEQAPEAQLAAPVALNVQVTDAWVRPAVEGQKATGAYLSVTANQAVRFVGASSPVAKTVELHEMKMDGDVMRMRKVDGGVELKADQAFRLEPGGYHLMLLDLTQAMVDGQDIDITLQMQKADGSTQDIPTKAKVRSLANDEHQQHEEHQH